MRVRSKAGIIGLLTYNGFIRLYNYYPSIKQKEDKI